MHRPKVTCRRQRAQDRSAPAHRLSGRPAGLGQELPDGREVRTQAPRCLHTHSSWGGGVGMAENRRGGGAGSARFLGATQTAAQPSSESREPAQREGGHLNHSVTNPGSHTEKQAPRVTLACFQSG